MVVSGGFLIWFSYVSTAGVAVLLMVLCLAAHSGVHVGFLVSTEHAARSTQHAARSVACRSSTD